MTKIIDNKGTRLGSVLNEEMSRVEEVAIASAYFDVSGFGAIRKGLADKPLLFLLGREPTETVRWEDQLIEDLERGEDDAEYFKLLKDAVNFFEDERRQIRMIEGKFFHGKAYIGAIPSLKNVKGGFGVVGSSNFTYGGLVSNRELNMLNTDREVVQDLANWFLSSWQESQDYKGTFLSFLKNYVTTRSAYEVAAKALYEQYKPQLEAVKDRSALQYLHPHQRLSVSNAKRILDQYGGVLIADATGLGKTRVALKLAWEAVNEGKKPLLIGPKSVIQTTWEEEMEKMQVKLEMVSSEQLSQSPDSISKYRDRDFIIVDEAHYFRHPSTRRYKALRDLILRNKAQVVLLTATPVNTSLMDLYSLFSLYLSEDAISDLGQQLRGYFTEKQKEWLRGEPVEMDEVLQRFMVRMSRLTAKMFSPKIRFPMRVLDNDPRDKYPLDVDCQAISELLDSMHMSFYDLSIEKFGRVFKLPDGTPVEKYAQEKERKQLEQLVKTIVKINVFKRLESSLKAFESTISSLRDYVENLAIPYARKGFFIPPTLREDPLFSFEEELPTPEEVQKQGLKLPKLDEKEASRFIFDCQEDVKTMNRLLSLLPNNDSKYEALESRLRELIGQLKENNGVLIFSEYETTARYLRDRLREFAESFGKKAYLVTGSHGSDEKVATIRDFREHGGILVSTDVLSEGQNLQNAQYVVNYDFPWNPVVLIQRVGRVDRLGSSYDRVYVINVMPKNGDVEDPTTLEHFLRLMQRLYMRLDAIRNTVGLDASTLGEEAGPKDFLVQEELATGKEGVLEDIARRLDQFTSDPMDTLAKIMDEKGLDWLEGLPNGIGAFKKSDRDALFVFFEDKEGSGAVNHYWRLKYFDGKGEAVTSSSTILQMLLSGDSESKGEDIDYDVLVNRMREVREELLAEFKREEDSRRTKLGPLSADKGAREVFDALSKLGDEGEKLAARFRSRSDEMALVKALRDAIARGDLMEKARELLTDDVSRVGKDTETSHEHKLTRVCWCWFRHEPEVSL
ncbi:helicase-related protein [Tardisphaera saccharovorans]